MVIRHFKSIMAVSVPILILDQGVAHAVVFEKMGTAVKKALASKSSNVGRKVFRRKGKKYPVFFTSKRLAVVETGMYPPNCTHTWVIGLDRKSSKVKSIRVVEMSCHHAFPCQKESFLDQYLGKGPAHTKKIKAATDTIAKATGSSLLTSDAVIRAIKAAKKYRRRLK